MTKGFPELDKLYGLLGAEKRREVASRRALPAQLQLRDPRVMYSWFNPGAQARARRAHRRGRTSSPSRPTEYLRCGPRSIRSRRRAKTSRRPSLKSLASSSDRQLAALSAAARREVTARAYDVMIGRSVPPAGSVSREKVDKNAWGDRWLFKDCSATRARRLPVVSFHPKGRNWNGKVVIWADGAGKAGLFSRGSEPRQEISNLLDAGFFRPGGGSSVSGGFSHRRGTRCASSRG